MAAQGLALADMALGPIPRAVRRLHLLAWQPGADLHADWWGRLGLASWQADYLRHPACRQAIDREIVARRGFPHEPLPGALDAKQTALLVLEPQLPRLLVALGLIVLDCPDYLLLGAYRRVLAIPLGHRACDQLLALPQAWRGGGARLAAEALVAGAAAAGAAWWARDQHGCPVRRALAGLFPLGEGPDPPPEPAADCLLRVERFL